MRFSFQHRRKLSEAAKRRWARIPAPAGADVVRRDGTYFYKVTCQKCPRGFLILRTRYRESMGLCRYCRPNRRRHAPFVALFRAFRIYARLRGKPFCLTFPEFLRFTRIPACHYCGTTLIWNGISVNGGRTNLDRKDNEQGYSSKNCVVCCKECNRIKGNVYSYEEMLQIGRFMRKFRRDS